MVEFWLSLAIFLGSHMAISRTRLKPFLISRIGKTGYFLSYSALSLILLGWLIIAAQNAPRIQLWPWDHGLYWIPNLLMPFAFIFLVAGLNVPNPLSISSGAEGFDPEKPGFIVATTRHPVLWGFLLWSLSHIIPNGEYPLVLMFVIFMLFSIAGMALLDFKRKREMTESIWLQYSKYTHPALFCSKAFLSSRFQLTKKDIFGIILGLFVYAVFYILHGTLFGIVPMPPL